VRAAIEELGYMPNLIAGGLSSRKSRMIAAILPTIASPMFSAPMATFTDAMAAAGYHVMLALSGYSTLSEDAQIRAVLARRPDGLLLTGAHRSEAIRALLHASNLPVVEIWDTAENPTDVLVGFDHAEVGAAVADFFVRQGHTHFAVLSARDARAVLRRQGFVDRVKHHGLTLVAERMSGSPSSIADGRNGLRQIIGQLGQRTALFASSDLVAFGALTEARLHGIGVPEQLAICGFGDFEIARACHPPISTVHVDGAEIGEIAAREMLARIQGGATPAPIAVPFQILPRATT
jgi:LacI family gluconate utilization system Gnt-I transcriptional repressor